MEPRQIQHWKQIQIKHQGSDALATIIQYQRYGLECIGNPRNYIHLQEKDGGRSIQCTLRFPYIKEQKADPVLIIGVSIKNVQSWGIERRFGWTLQFPSI